ncbi:MAG: hypothetical protein ACRCUS_06390 [Anaerovoracaceae bacterium]
MNKKTIIVLILVFFFIAAAAALLFITVKKTESNNVDKPAVPTSQDITQIVSSKDKKYSIDIPTTWKDTVITYDSKKSLKDIEQIVDINTYAEYMLPSILEKNTGDASNIRETSSEISGKEVIIFNTNIEEKEWQEEGPLYLVAYYFENEDDYIQIVANVKTSEIEKFKIIK